MLPDRVPKVVKGGDGTWYFKVLCSFSLPVNHQTQGAIQGVLPQLCAREVYRSSQDMGTVLSNLPRRLPTAAPHAAAAIKFPPPPKVPASSSRPLNAVDELQQNRLIAQVLGETTILTQNQDAANRSQAAPSGINVKEAALHGLPSQELAQLLAMHAKEPQRWDEKALAERFSVQDEAALSSALLHLQTYEVQEDADSGKMLAVPLTPESHVESTASHDEQTSERSA